MSLTDNKARIQELLTAINELPDEKKLQTSKTVTPTTSVQTVSPDSGYDGLSSVTINAMPAATQATPSITVSSSGLITAKTTQSAGYVANGTKSATKQLTTQAAKTITPGTSSQTAVASGVYTTGAVTVAAIPNTYQNVGSTVIANNQVEAGVTYYDSEGKKAGNLITTTVRASGEDGGLHSINVSKQDVSGDTYLYVSSRLGNARASHVLAGDTFTTSYGTGGVAIAGTMPNNGAINSTMDGLDTKSVTIPAGYTSGGTVSLDDTIDTVADTQAAKLAQLKTILEGKAGGGSIDTCTVTLTSEDLAGRAYFCVYVGLDESGNVAAHNIVGNNATTLVLEDVVCGSVVAFTTYNGTYHGAEVENMTSLTLNNQSFMAFSVDAKAGGSAKVTTIFDSSDGFGGGGGE